MKLKDLRTYYRLREYQITHLLSAQECHALGTNADLNMWLFLLLWADAMCQADEMLPQIPWSVLEEGRGRA
jgi:hypothetical protein